MKSDVITVTPATYARAAISRLASRRWWVAVVPMCAFAVASLWDTAYIFAAMIWLLMLLPPALMIAYYSYLLKPHAAMLSRPHRVEVSDTGDITVTFEPVELTDPDGNVTRHIPYPDIHLPALAMRDCIDRGTRLELCYPGLDPDILIIPADALPPASLRILLSTNK